MLSPEVLYQSTGLKIVRNPHNQFAVCTLHHTADPAKRSEEWRREAAAGLTPEQAARELDIDYTAVLGAKVFPEITNYRASIVVEAPYPELGMGAKYYGGFDYGPRNPSSFHVYAVDDGMVWSVWELFKPCHNVPEFVAEMKACPYWNRIRWISADPSCWAPSQQQSVGNPISIYDMFWRNGIRNMVKGINNQEDAWIAQIREHWASEDCTFKIFSRCHNQIREFETSIFVNQSERQLLTSAYNEKIQDKDNHSLDDCKYMMLNLPKSGSGSSGTYVQDQWKRWAVPDGRPQLATEPVPRDIPNGLKGRGYR